MIVYTISVAMIFESVSYLLKNLSTLSTKENEIKQFEYVMFYINSQIKGKVPFKIVSGTNWSVLVLDTKPVLGFEIFSSNDLNTLRRIVGKGNFDFSILQKGVGLTFFNGHNFSGFNTIYKGKKKMNFEMEGKHLLFKWGERWFYLM